MSVGPRSEKFNRVSNDHGCTQKCDFCVSVCKTNFTDHHTPDAIRCFSILTTIVLENWFWSVKYTTVTVRYAKNFKHFYSFPSSATYQVMQVIEMVRLYENKPLDHIDCSIAEK